MSLSTILLVILISILVGIVPIWPYSRSWGYVPTGGVGMVALVIMILLLLDRI